MAIKLSGTSQMLAAVPHLLGFAPDDSLVVVSLTGGLHLRVSHPHTPDQLLEVATQIGAAYQRNRTGEVAIACYTANTQHARDAVTVMTAILDDVTTVVGAVQVLGSHWFDLVTGEAGAVTDSDTALVAAEFTVAGHARPADSRHAAAQTLTGDPEPVADQVTDALQRALAGQAQRGADWLRSEARWLHDRIGQFLADQVPFTDAEAARTLVAIDKTDLRNVAWQRMGHDDAMTHVTLWRDLTRRAPDYLRTPAATLLAFAAWLSGDGAYAWLALERIPEDELPGYNLAVLVGHALTNAVPPTAWAPVSRPHPLLT